MLRQVGLHAVDASSVINYVHVTGNLVAKEKHAFIRKQNTSLFKGPLLLHHSYVWWLFGGHALLGSFLSRSECKS